MPLKIYDTIKPDGTFPIAEAGDVSMPDGTRLDEFLEDITLAYPVETSGTQLQPETYYSFGEVNELTLELVDPGDGLAHEYCFDFIPTENFTNLNITPTVNWMIPCVFLSGKTHQASIMQGIGVMIRA